MNPKFKEKDFQTALFLSFYAKGHSPIIPNFSGINRWESDMFTITKSKFSYEYEIKLSRSDFKNDFKNKAKKHDNFSRRVQLHSRDKKTIKAPNYFTFVCPEGMISVDEIPDYAGLVYISQTPEYAHASDSNIHRINRLDINVKIQEIKKPKQLHDVRANDALYKKIAHVYSVRQIFGNAFYNYSKENGHHSKRKK